MRVTKLEIEGFRAYGSRVVFDCSGEAVVLVGPNGAGKTSFFDAISWCLFGDIGRLRGSRDAVGEEYVANRFAPDVLPHVALHLNSGDRTALVSRTGPELHVVEDEVNFDGAEATQWVAELLRSPHVPHDVAIEDPELAFDRCYLLGQEQMAAFLRSTNPRQRFDALSSFLGVDIVKEFFRHEERVVASLQSKGSSVERQLLVLDQRLERLRIERAELTPREEASPLARVERLAQEALALFGEVEAKGIDVTTDEVATSAPRDLVHSLEGLNARLEGALQAARQRTAALQQLVDDSEDFDGLRRTIRELEEQRVARNTELGAIRAQVAAATDAAEQIRSKQNEIAVRISDIERDRNDFNEFLVLARNHVSGDSCPLCEQKIDPQRVAARLEERIAEIPGAIRQLTEERRELQHKAADSEGALAELRSQEQLLIRQISEAASSIRQATRRISSWTDQAARLGVKEGNTEQIASRLRQEADVTSSLVELRERSDEIRVQAQYLAARDRLTKLTEEERLASVDSERLTQELSKLKEAQARLSSIVQIAKQSEQEIVAELLSRQEPLLNALYQRLRPHPVLDQLKIDYGAFAERGEVYFQAASRETIVNVSTIFSSAQLNAVAACIFLSLNLTQRGSALDLVMLDDPIQNMDDFNVLGLLDLLRGFVKERQVFIATHDIELGSLIQRKLRPLMDGHRTITHEFVSYDRSGPQIRTSIDRYEPEPHVLEAVAG